MNSTKIWLSSNISMREEFYKLLHNAPGVSRKKLHQIGKVENYNWGCLPSLLCRQHERTTWSHALPRAH